GEKNTGEEIAGLGQAVISSPGGGGRGRLGPTPSLGSAGWGHSRPASGDYPVKRPPEEGNSDRGHRKLLASPHYRSSSFYVPGLAEGCPECAATTPPGGGKTEPDAVFRLRGTGLARVVLPARVADVPARRKEGGTPCCTGRLSS